MIRIFFLCIGQVGAYLNAPPQGDGLPMKYVHPHRERAVIMRELPLQRTSSSRRAAKFPVGNREGVAGIAGIDVHSHFAEPNLRLRSCGGVGGAEPAAAADKK